MALLSAIGRMAPGAEPLVRSWFTQLWYQLISVWSRPGQNTFMNYGFAPLAEAAEEQPLPDDPAWFSARLYEQVVRPVDLRDRDVLEVGCGRGGGAHFIQTHFEPRSVTGLDFAGRAIAFCQQQYHVPGLRFQRGGAEALPFPPASFHVVLNVESSHGYASVERFLSEVRRVLRPGGYLLLADLREAPVVPVLRDQVRQAGLIIDAEEDITANVFRALELTSSRKLRALSVLPSPIRGAVEDFTALEASPVYESLRTRRWRYVRFVARKPGAP